MKRRDLLKGSILTAGSVLSTACGNSGEQLIPILVPAERYIPGVEQWLATACYECVAGCGLVARKIDGRIVKIEGNPEHPISRGSTCARAQALPQALYHPDRLRSPLVREGRRGDGHWKEIGWEDALDKIVSELAPLEKKSNGGRLAFLTGELRGHRENMVRRFLEAFGSRDHMVHDAFGESGIRHVHRLATGSHAFFSYDLENSNYVVSFGAGLVDTSRSPVRFSRGLAHMRRGRAGRRGKLVTVEPRLSLTGVSADEWVPAKSGTESAVALALANVLIREELYDKDFVGSHTAEFERFRYLVLTGFDPERIAEMADVSASTLVRIAREMAAHRPSLAIAGNAAVSGPSGLATASAVAHLNALLGSFGVEGGIFFDPQPSFAPWPSHHKHASVEPRSLAASIQQRVFKEDIRVLFTSETNPVYSLPTSFGLENAFGNVPFIVSFATFADETTNVADLILPEPTSFERFDDDVPTPGTGRPVASVCSPILAAPLYETRSMPNVLIQLASRLSPEMHAAFPWKSYEQALRAAWTGLAAGSTEGSETEFWREAVKRGGWWDETYIPRADFSTPDERYSFDVSFLQAMTLLPKDSDEFPLSLHIYPSAAFGDGRSANLPFLQELADPMTGTRWGTVVEMNPNLAERLGISQGELVEVTSAHGRLSGPAHLSEAVRPDTIAVAAGQGHTHYGRFATGKGSNAFHLLAPEPSPYSMGPSVAGTRVRVRRA